MRTKRRALKVWTTWLVAFLAAIVSLTPVFGGVCNGGNNEGTPCTLDSDCQGGRCAACTAPPANMLAWWPADNSPVDVISGNNGTLQSGATFSAAGKVLQSFDLDGTNDFVACGTSALLRPTNALSVDAWIFMRVLGPGDVASYNFSSNMGYQLVFGGTPVALRGQIGDGRTISF